MLIGVHVHWYRAFFCSMHVVVWMHDRLAEPWLAFGETRVIAVLGLQEQVLSGLLREQAGASILIKGPRCAAGIPCELLVAHKRPPLRRRHPV